MADIRAGRHGGNPESVAAHASTPEAERRAMRDRIYNFAVRRGESGITADEVADKAGLVHNRVAPRISELRRDGLLVETSRSRKTRLGRSARVLIADIHARWM